MQIVLLVVGKLKERFYRDAVAEYEKRLKAYATLVIQEVEDEPDRIGEEKIMGLEGQRILSQLKERDYVIVLDRLGKQMPSQDLAKKIEELASFHSGRIVFIIGGSVGLSQAVIKKANLLLSFSQFTFPHQLMRVILIEQIYRAFRINTGASYHK